MPLTRPILATLALFNWHLPAMADLQATQRLEATWATATDLDGEVVQLSAADAPFVAIYRPQARGKARGSVVLLHGRGTNANSYPVIRPLRIGLSEQGWNTLSLQLPLVRAGADAQAWSDNANAITARLQASLDWLTQRGQRNQVIVALGDSAPLAMRFVASGDPASVRALVLVSVPGEFSTDADRQALAGLKRPLLDVFAERDSDAVIGGAQARSTAAREAGSTRYVQRRIAGATLDFPGQEAQLLATIRAWLNANATGNATRESVDANAAAE